MVGALFTEVFAGAQDACEVTSELVLTLPQPHAALAFTCLGVCAYAGTGNVLKIQNLLHICSEHYTSDKDKKVILILEAISFDRIRRTIRRQARKRRLSLAPRRVRQPQRLRA